MTFSLRPSPKDWGSRFHKSPQAEHLTFTLEPRLQPMRARLRTLGDLLWSPNWILGSWFCRARCSFGYHNRIGNRLRNIDGF